MTYIKIAEGLALVAVSLAVAAIPGVASAQLVANPLQTNEPANGVVGSNGGGGTSNSGNGSQNSGVSGTGVLRGKSKLSAKQLRTIMMLRALQSRGRGQVRRGVPQFIPFGAPNFYPNLQGTASADDHADDEAKAEARRQRLIEARKATEEKRRAAREARLKAKRKAAQP